MQYGGWQANEKYRCWVIRLASGTSQKVGIISTSYYGRRTNATPVQIASHFTTCCPAYGPSCHDDKTERQTQDERHYQEPGLMLNSKEVAYLSSFIGGLVNKETGMTSKDK
jgi:hypothetical protein